MGNPLVVVPVPEVPQVCESRHMGLLFVCTGNICRSPIAERLASAFFEQLGMTDMHVASAGTSAVVGSGVDPRAAAALRALGGNDSDFRARQLGTADVEAADLVLTMSRSHRRQVLSLVPGAMNRTFALLEAADLLEMVDPGATGTDLVAALARGRAGLAGRRLDTGDVMDPMGRSSAVHEAVAGHIAVALFPILQRLVRTPASLPA